MERFKLGFSHANINHYQSWISLTVTCSESVGPTTRFWWAVTRRRGHVCYLHWVDVHTHLHCQTPQVCHLVSDRALFILPLSQSHCALSLPAIRGRTRVRQMGSGTYPFSRQTRLCELMQSCDMVAATFHSSTAETPPAQRVRLPYDMSRLATGRSALDPLQRSCGTKVRRVAACRWTLRQTRCDLIMSLALTSFRWSMGSVLFLAAWSVMMGPIQYGKQASPPQAAHLHAHSRLRSSAQHLISGPRLPFTAAYFGSIALTLFFSLGVSSPYLDILGMYALRLHTPCSSTPRTHTSLIIVP